MAKFLIITDSIGNPRSFPVQDKVELEQTFPYLLRTKFKNDVFWQLSYGDMDTEKLMSQPLTYLVDWEPDYVIIQSGLNDCRPEAFTEFQKKLIFFLRFLGMGFLRKYLYNPSLVKFRQVQRIPIRSFERILKKISILFDNSKIYWIEICAGHEYEKVRPGVNKKILEFNKVLKENFADGFIYVFDRLIEVDGFNKDQLHWNSRGHLEVSKILTSLIK